MKKSTISVIVSSIVLVGIVFGVIYWWTTFAYPDGPEFSVAQGNFTSGPIVTQSGGQYTIIWSTTGDYPKNEVLLKISSDTNPSSGVGADSTYDATNNVYMHTASFRLSSSTETSITGNSPIVNSDDFKIVPMFAEGKYTYQIKSSGLSSKEVVISDILPL